jgi:hypothetical protein
MKRHVIAGCMVAVIAGSTIACSSLGSAGSAANVFEQLGGSKNMTSIATELVNSALKDPQLASLAGGKTVDAAASSGAVSNQLCAMLGGGCKAPLSDSQVTAAADKVSPSQSEAIAGHFSSSLEKIVSDPTVRELVTKTVGNKVPGVLSALL